MLHSLNQTITVSRYLLQSAKSLIETVKGSLNVRVDLMNEGRFVIDGIEQRGALTGE